jgi:arsenate reductase
MPKQKVLILCTGNSARSQMAEGLLRHEAGGRFEGGKRRHQAGTGAAGSDRRHEGNRHRSFGPPSKHVDEFAGESFDYVLTVCDNAKESCPVFPGHGNRLHHAFEDPAALQGSEEERLALFRRVRDEIREYLKTFPAKQNW